MQIFVNSVVRFAVKFGKKSSVYMCVMGFGTNPGKNCHLSLNKKDILDDESVKLKDLELVSGDSVYVLGATAPSVVPGQNENNKQSQSHDAKRLTNSTISSTIPHKSDSPSCSYVASQTEELRTTVPSSSNMEVDTANRDSDKVNRYLNEPLLCSDSTENAVPCILEQIYNSAECKNNHDAVFISLHVMCMESGLIVSTKNEEAKESRSFSGMEESISQIALPTDWKGSDGKCYNVSYTHRTCNSQHTCSLTAIPMGGNLLVYGKLDGEYSEPYHLQLTSKAYVNEDSVVDVKEACKSYKDLSKLSRLFKDNIVIPVVQAIRSECGLENTDGLMGLPLEIKLRIFAYMDVKSLLNTIVTCKEFQILGQDAALWRALYLRTFGGVSDNSLSQDWHKKYKTEYCRRLEWKRAAKQMTILADPPHFMGYPNPVNPLVPPTTFGMIGGDYDLNPQFHFIPDHVHRQPRHGVPQGPLSMNPPRPRFFPTGPLPGNPRLPRGPFGGFGF